MYIKFPLKSEKKFIIYIILLGIWIITGCSRDPILKKQKHFNKGLNYFNEKNYNAAIIEFKNTLKIDPNQSEAYYYLGKSYFAAKKIDNAFDAFDKAIKMNNSLLSARLDKASIHILKNQLQESSDEIEYVLKKDPNNARAYNLRGNIHLLKKNYRKGFDDFKTSISLDQKDIKPRLDLVKFYIIIRNYKLAEKEINEILQIDNKALEARLLQAELHIKGNKIDEAIKEFELIISQYPKKVEGYLGLANLYLQKKENKKLKDLANKILEDEPESYIAKLFLGIALIREEEYENAIKYLQEAIKYLPQNSQAHYYLGIAFYGTNNIQQAISECLEALKFDSDSIPIMGTLAIINLERGWYEESIKYCKKILQISPQNGVVQCMLEIAALRKYDISSHLSFAVMYFFNEDYSKAVEKIKKSLDNDQENPFAYSLLGNIYSVQKNMKDAIINFELSIKIEPRLISSMKSLALIHIIKKDFSNTVFYLKKAIAIDPFNVDLYCQIGNVYNIQGMNQEAISYFEKAIEIDPQSVKPYILLGKIYMNMKRPDQAISSIQRIIELKPSEPLLHSLLGSIYRSQEKFSEALAEYQKVIEFSSEQKIEIGSEYENAYIILGLIYMVMESQEEALSTFELLLEKNPENLDALKGLAVLHNLRKEYEKASGYIDKAIHIDDENEALYFIKANICAAQEQYQRAGEVYIKGNFLVQELRKRAINLEDYYSNNPYFIGSRLSLIANYLDHAWIDIVIKEEKKLIDKFPDNPLVNYLMGTYYIKKDLSKAIAYFEKTIQNDPKLYSANKIIGDIYDIVIKNPQISNAQRNDYINKAINAYKAYLNGYKDDINVLLKLGMLFEYKGDYQMAINIYKEILESNSNAIVPLNNLAWIYAEHNIDLDKALDYAQKAVRLNPSDGNILDTLGWIYCKRGQYKEALQYLKKAVELKKKHPSIYYHLAFTYYKDNQIEDAIETLKIALNLADNFPEVKDAKKLFKELQSEKNL